MTEKNNYCIGRIVPNTVETIIPYTFHNQPVFYTDEVSANNTLKHIKEKNPYDNPRLFVLIDITPKGE